MGRMTLNLAGFSVAASPEDASSGAVQSHSVAAAALGPPLPGATSCAASPAATALADAIAAVYPVVNLLPVTSTVRPDALPSVPLMIDRQLPLVKVQGSRSTQDASSPAVHRCWLWLRTLILGTSVSSLLGPDPQNHRLTA